MTDNELEYLCETLVDNALHAQTPIEMKGIIETALYHREKFDNENITCPFCKQNGYDIK